MTGKTSILLICFSLMILSGCAGNTVFSVEIYETATPDGDGQIEATRSATPSVMVSDLPTATPTIPPVPSNTPIPESISLPAAAVEPFMAPDFSPILYGKKYDANMFFLLLGGVQGNTWFTSEQAAAQFGGEWEYDVYTFANRKFSVRGHSPELSPPSRAYFIGTDVNFNEFGMVGVLHGWPVRQGNVHELSTENETYEQVVVDWLKAEGVAAPELGTLDIFRVDLEADGVDEIFLSATHLDESQHYTKSGDHSIVLMRKVVGNEVVTLRIVADIYRSGQAEITYPSTYSLGNFIDLNRDGVLEVIVDIQRWEGFGAIVYQVDGQNVTERLR
jgi:hypothetical protein